MTFKIHDLTLEKVRAMLAEGDDRHDNQIRVKLDGTVYLSQDVVGAEDIDNLAFRFDTFDAYDDYVGENAAKDDTHVTRIYKALQANWPNPKRTYIDDWNCEGIY